MQAATKAQYWGIHHHRTSVYLIYLALLQDIRLLPYAVLHNKQCFSLMPLYRFAWETLSKAKHTVPTHPSTPLPPSWYKTAVPFVSLQKMLQGKLWCYVFHIKRNSSGCDPQHCVAEDSLLLPLPHKNTWDNRDISLSNNSDWKKRKERTESLSVYCITIADEVRTLYCLDSVIDND